VARFNARSTAQPLAAKREKNERHQETKHQGNEPEQGKSVFH
jgi:hypothetical protein